MLLPVALPGAEMSTGVQGRFGCAMRLVRHAGELPVSIAE